MTTQSIIPPSIGRKVWFWPAKTEGSLTKEEKVANALGWITKPKQLDAAQAFDATVIFVHDDRKVNLLVCDHAGLIFIKEGVTLAQPGDDALEIEHAAWMPYQVGQAAKAAKAAA